MDDIEQLYTQALQEVTGSHDTDVPPPTIYTGEKAFRMFLSCIKIDVAPPGLNGVYYKLKIERLDRDTLMVVLTSIRTLFEPTDESKRSTSRLRKELNALGMGYMSRYTKCHKDETYTLEIRHIPYCKITSITRILFGW